MSNRLEFLHSTLFKNKVKIYTPTVKTGFIPAGTVMVAIEWEKQLVFKVDFNDTTIFEKVGKS